MRSIEKLAGYFVFTNIFLSLCVTSLVFETYLILYGTIPSLHYPLFLFCSTLFLYSFHRVFRFGAREENEKLASRHLWVVEHRTLFFTVMALAAIGISISILFFVRLSTLFYLLPVAAISFAYTIPCIPAKGKWIRLRDIPGIKIFLISLVLGLTTVLLPILDKGDLLLLQKPEMIYVFFRRLLFIFAITIPFDIRDMEYDKVKGTKTIPLLVGIKGAKSLAILALGLFAGLTFFQYFSADQMDAAYPSALVISAFISGIAIWNAKESSSDYYYSFLLEGMMLAQCLAIIAASRL